ncbi:MAG: hypothetical protein D6702_02020 [Planctomycetota bacterium]|nr:MAG: hypothetical protein D6702_02020 [Planctomycetota bacterium]
MRRVPVLIALFLAPWLGSCLGGSSSGAGAAAAPGAENALAGQGGPGLAAGAAAHHLPTFRAPEEFLLEAERLYRVRDAAGAYEVFREVLRADGQGQFALELTGHQPAGAAAIGPPSLDWQARYEFRQRFLVHFRDLHRGSEESLRRNYVWEELPGSVTMAGRSCSRHLVTNRYGYGSIELTIDDQLELLLGWVVRDETGQELSSLETTALNLAPNLTGVTWSAPAAPIQPYRGPIDDPVLGFTPLSLHYAPAGYFPTEERMVLTEQVFGTSIRNFHVEVLHDGLQTILIGQQGGNGTGPGGPIQKTIIKLSDLGGVRVVEGPIGARQVCVLGTAPMQELRATWNSTSQF